MPPPRRIVKHSVFCAGEGKSENGYLRWLNRLAGAQGIAIAITADPLKGGDPLALVEQCIDRLKHYKLHQRSFSAKLLLLDDDRHGQDERWDDEARRLAAKEKLALIWQRPTHEALLLRHFAGCEGQECVDAGDSLHRLRRVWPSYEKGRDATGYEAMLTADHLVHARKHEPELARLLAVIGWP